MEARLAAAEAALDARNAEITTLQSHVRDLQGQIKGQATNTTPTATVVPPAVLAAKGHDDIAPSAGVLAADDPGWRESEVGTDPTIMEAYNAMRYPWRHPAFWKFLAARLPCVQSCMPFDFRRDIILSNEEFERMMNALQVPGQHAQAAQAHPALLSECAALFFVTRNADSECTLAGWLVVCRMPYEECIKFKPRENRYVKADSAVTEEIRRRADQGAFLDNSVVSCMPFYARSGDMLQANVDYWGHARVVRDYWARVEMNLAGVPWRCESCGFMGHQRGECPQARNNNDDSD